MLNLFNTNIETISFHKIGNKSRVEGAFLTKEPVRLNDEITPLLKEYFFKPFRDYGTRFFKFGHDVSLEYNAMFVHCKEIFDNPGLIHDKSRKIANHLYDQSNHPHVKTGEIAVMYLTNITIDNTPVDAIGIFKSEIKSDFLQFEERNEEQQLDLILQQGISLTKVDKGCLILNYKESDGYKVLSIDNNRYDARYWLEHFLGIEVFEDENFYTEKYIDFCGDFAKNVVLPAEGKIEEVLFMNKALDYFAKNDEFEEEEFLEKSIANEDLIPEFQNYKATKGASYSIDGVTDFPISNEAVTDMLSKHSQTINLDTNISIKMNFVNPESVSRFIEKGWDEEKQMYYYLVYFNQEQKSK